MFVSTVSMVARRRSAVKWLWRLVLMVDPLSQHLVLDELWVRWPNLALWPRLHRAVLDELGAPGLIDWSRAVLDGAPVRAKKWIHDWPEPGRSR
jgi:hypothetical protein